MVVMDSTFVGIMLHPKAKIPDDPATQKPVSRVPDRIQKLLQDLTTEQERIVIPTPALTEFLVLAGKDANQYLSEIHSMRSIWVRPFDEMAAVELAAIECLARETGNKRHPVGGDRPWQKVKVDRQIVAIAKGIGAKRIYSDDPDIKKFAEKEGIKVIACWELTLPPSNTPLLDDLEDESPE